jgi:glycosyltransferase involved in cell wall biosynthesis
MISVLIPSRGRPVFLSQTITHIKATATKDVEILVAVDPDDPETKAVAERRKCVVVEAPERFGYQGLYRYFNLMADQATGSWMVLWDDQSAIMTPAWNDMIEALPANIVVGDLQNHFSPQLCCFPAVRSDAVKALGCYSYETPHVDTFWETIGRRLGAIQPVPAYVHHERPDITGIAEDATHIESRAGMQVSNFYSSEFQQRMFDAAERIRSECLQP